MRAFPDAVVHRLDRNRLGRVPLVHAGLGEGQRITGPRDARDGLGAAADRRTVDGDQFDLAVEREINLDGAGGLLGQHHPVAVLTQSSRRQRIGAPALGHNRLVVALAGGVVVGRDQHRGGIVVHHGRDHPEHRQAVIGSAVLGTDALLGAVYDAVAVGAFGQRILPGVNIDGLWHEPVVAREDQGGTVLAGQGCCGGGPGGGGGIGQAVGIHQTQLDALAAGLLRAFGQRHRHGGHRDVLLRSPGQYHLVGVDHQVADIAVLEHADRADGLSDHHIGHIVVAHIRDDILDEDILVLGVVGGGGLHHQAAMALKLVADHRDFGAVAAADVEGIAAEATDDPQIHARAGALDEEAVVAFDGIDDDTFQPGIGDEQAGTVDALVVDHEIVAELGADDGQGVETVATVYAHRRVDRERDEVRALAAVDVGERGLGIVRVHLDEGPHREGVVVLVAVQEQLRLVAVDGEGVLAGATKHHGALADAVGKEAARHLGGLEVVLLGQPVIRIAAIAERLVDLADLEGVVAGVAKDGGRREVVVEHEGIVAVAAVDLDRAADVGVVVDAFDDATGHRHPVCVHLDRRHHADADILVRPQQEEVGLIGAVDAQPVDAGIAMRLVEHVDARGYLPGQADLVKIAALLAVQAEFAVDSAGEGLLALVVVVDADNVVALAGVDGGGPGNGVDVDDVIGAVQHRLFVAGVDEGHPGMRRVDREIVVAIGEPDLEHVETAVTDAQRHAHANEFGGRKPAVFALAVAGIKNLQSVDATAAGIHLQAALDRVDIGVEGVQHAGHLAEMGGGGAHPHRVAAAAGCERHVTGHGLDIEDVGAAAAADVGHRAVAVRAFNAEHIAVRRVAEVDAERFQRGVADAAAGTHEGDARTADHAVGDARGRQGCVVGGGVGRIGIVEVEPVAVARALAVHRQQGIDEVQDAAGIGIRLPQAAQRGFAADVDGVAAGAGVQGRAGVDATHRQPVVAATGVDLDVLHPLVGDRHRVRQRGLARAYTQRLDGAGGVHAGTVGGQQEAVGGVAAGHHQPVATVGAS